MFTIPINCDIINLVRDRLLNTFYRTQSNVRRKS